MSSKTKGKSPKSPKSPKSAKSTGAKSEASFVPEALPPVTPVPAGNDPKTIIFPEWSDQDVNTEKWDMPKAKDRAKTPPKKSPLTPVTIDEEPSQFVDPHVVRLPHSLDVHKWKRPSEVFLGMNLVMYNESPEYPDLLSGSKHILHSDFMRGFISAVGVLEYLGNARPSPIEFASPTYVPNTAEKPWRPWHHIYSMCKAGKGQKHNPQVNRLGKYVVRLFWMGCWRRITIDDQLPVDLTNHALLPSLNQLESNPTQTNREIEMWPFLLCKALLKIANLTQTQVTEILDFDMIHCLTGWFVQKIDVTGMDALDIWEMCAAYSDHYTWPDLTKKQDSSKKGSKGKSSTKGSKSKSSTKGSKSKSSTKGSKSKSSTTGKNVPNFLDDSGIIPYHLLATCSDMRTLAADHVPDISPCWSHCLLIDQTRDIPLIKPDPLPELARWKRFRWLAWAIRKGLWPAQELIPLKCFKTVSVFKGCAEHVVYKPPSKEAIDIQKSVAVIEDLALKMGDGKNKGKKGLKKDLASKMSDGKNKGKKGSKKSQSSTASKKSAGKNKGKKGSKKSQLTTVALPQDPSLWIDFNKLGPYITCLYIFFKKSQFKTYIKITDIAQVAGEAKPKADKGKKKKPDDTSSSEQLLIWNNKVAPCRNEPVYLFTETIDYKLIVINVAQVGNTNALEQVDSGSELVCGMEPQRKETISSTDVLKGFPDTASALEIECTCPHVPYTYVIIENYDWQTNKIGDTTSFLNTYGNKTMLIDVKPGRFVLRMWIKSDTSYVINLVSDSPVFAGTLEAMLENMCQESKALMKLCHDISSGYGQLVQKFGTPKFSEGLISFCKTYLPDTKVSKQDLLKVHNCFLWEFLNVVKENCPLQECKERLHSLKVLFMNPTLKFHATEERNPKLKKNIECNINKQIDSDEISQTSEDIQLIKKTERAAVVLQAYFKKNYVRKLRSLHKESHKDYLKIFDTLRKIYMDCFGVQKRMWVCSTLLRNFLLLNSDMSTLRHYYSLLNDLNATIHLQHFTGNVFTTSNTWCPIARYVFYCNCPDVVNLKICLFCGFPKFMVRVFDNDTNQEIQRFTNNTIVYSYKSNLAGYTVFCYGWTEVTDNFQWKLDFITVRQKFDSLIIVPPVSLYKCILQQNYRPNVSNYICRCMVNINHDVLATFRLSTSYENVKICFRCMNDVGQTLSEICGIASVILPTVMLKFVPVAEDIAESISSSRRSTQERRSSKSKSRSGTSIKALTITSLKKKTKSSDRMSLEGPSSRDSQTRRSHSQSVIKYKDTVYIIEGFVVDDSWPLTKQEWNVVEQVKIKSLIGSIAADYDTSSSRSSSVKIKDMFSSKKSVQETRKSVEEKRRSSNLITQEPFWCLETISNVDDSLITHVDKRRQEEISDIKRQWYEDPERYGKSQQIRREYLESHYIKFDEPSLESSRTEEYSPSNYESSEKNELSTIRESVEVTLIAQEESQNNMLDEQFSSSIITIDKCLRTLQRPVSTTKMLPPFNLEDYFVQSKRSMIQAKDKMEEEEEEEEEVKEEEEKEEEDEKYVKTPEYEEELTLQREQKITDFELDQLKFEQDMNNYLVAQMERHKLLDNFYKRCRTESHEMMHSAYDLREDVIDIIIEKAEGRQNVNKNTKEPKKTKKK